MAHEKIVTAFNQIQQAESAKERLIVEGIAEKNIDIISGERLRVEGKEIRHPSFWQRLFGDDVDDNNAAEYSKAMQAGGVLLTVRAPKDQASHIEDELSAFAADYASTENERGPLSGGEFAGETDDRLGSPTGSLATKNQFGSGTDNPPGTGRDSLTNISAEREELSGTDTERNSLTGVGTERDALSGTGTERDSLNDVGTERDALRLAKENVEIGKRQVNDGAVRLRRYTVEDEVAEDVSLYDQHAEVFRRAVDEPAYLNDVDWSDKTVEVEESHEVPTVAKTARVKEEVGLRGEETARVETVKDSVRRQEVEVERADENRLTGDVTGNLTDDTTGNKKF